MCVHVYIKRRKSNHYIPSHLVPLFSVTFAVLMLWKQKIREGTNSDKIKKSLYCYPLLDFQYHKLLVVTRITIMRPLQNFPVQFHLWHLCKYKCIHTVMFFLYLHNCWQFSCVCLNKNCSVLIHYLKFEIASSSIGYYLLLTPTYNSGNIGLEPIWNSHSWL